MTMFSVKRIKLFISILIFLVPLFYVTFVYQRLIFDPPNVILEETIGYEVPPLISVYESLKMGTVPLWDNRASSGISTIGDPMYQQTNFLTYPLMFIFKDNAIFAMRIYFFIQLLIAACSFFFLLIYLKINRFIALLGTVIFMSTYYIVVFTMQAAFRPDLLAITYLPLIFLLLLVALDRKSMLFSISAGVAFSQLVHAGALHFSLITLILLTIFSLFYIGLVIFKGKERFKKGRRLFMIFCVFVLFCFGFSAIKAIPVIEFLQLSPRQALSLEASEQGMDLTQFKTALQYNFQQFLPTHFGGMEPLKIQPFIIWLFFIIAFFAIFSKRKVLILALVLTILVSILISWAKSFPIDFYALLYNYLPGFKSMRNPMRFFIFVWFGVPLLFAFGADYINQTKGRMTIFKLPLIIAFVFVTAILTFQGRKIIDSFAYPIYSISEYDKLLKSIKADETFPYRIAGDFATLPINRSALPAYLYTSALIDNFDTTINVYNDVRPYYYNYYHIPDFKKVDPIDFPKWHKNFSLVNVKYLVVPEQKLPESQLFKDITEDVSKKYDIKVDGRLIEILNTRQRFSFIPNGILYVGGGTEKDKYSVENVKKIIFHERFDLSKQTVFKGESVYLDDYLTDLANFDTLVLNQEKIRDQDKINSLLESYKERGGVILRDFELPALKDSTQSGQFKINSFTEKPGKLEIDFTTDKGGFFVYSNTYYPGWEAQLNSKPTNIYMADSVAKGVIIPEGGQYRLLLEYKPKSFYLGLAITGITIVFTIIFMLRRKSPQFK